MTPPETQLFSSLPGGRFSRRAFAVSVSLHCIIVTILICAPLALTPEVQYTIRFVEIKPPFNLPRVAPRPPARAKPPVIRAPLVFSDPPIAEPRPAPKRELKIPEEHLAARKAVEFPAPEVAPPPAEVPPVPPVVLTPAVKVGVFPGGASADTLNRKPRELEASGFEDRRDMPRQTDGRAEVAVVGAFEAPAGTGARSGSSRKGRDVVAGTGFANNVAGGGSAFSGTGVSRSSVREGGFGDVHLAASAAQPRPQPVRPALLAAEIVSKPKPAYTKEARDLGLEGEVVLEVLFAASGEARVLAVIRGLGHGLDEAAARAAEQIRFKPAEREGRPVDSKSVVQIIFRLT